MEPISQKAETAGATRQAFAGGQKSGPSRFDLLRADLNQKLAGATQIPDKVTSVNDQQKMLLENDLRRKLESGRTPQELIGGDLKQLGNSVTDLNRQVAAIPNTSAFVPLRERLQSIESDFNASANLLKQPGNFDDPKRLLEMQLEMYKLAQNVEILSRVVSDVASGVKTIVQTQI